MFRFEHIYILYGLTFIPVFWAIFLINLKRRKNALKKFGDKELVGELMPEVSKSKSVYKLVLFSLAFVSLFLALANPQSGTKLEKAKRKGVDLMIAFDLSKSMLAEDIQPNRLQRAKQAISKLIDRLEGDRIGIVVFGGKAYTQLPITTDYSAAKLFLSTISTDLMPVQGTAIGSAIDLAVSSFEKNETKKNRAIIIISDGENHEDDAVEQAKIAASEGIIVHTLGMGSTDGVPIPVYNNNILTGYKKDNSGNTVMTKLDETMLQQIAAAGGGIYVRANNTETGLNTIFDKINKMEKKEFESRVFTDYEDRFQYFIAFSILIFALELLIFERKNRFFTRLNIFGKNRDN